MNNGVFGYVPRYAEYKYNISGVHGDFRTSLDFWHMDRKFNASPNLNADFVVCNPDDRNFAVTDSDVQHLWAHVYIKMQARRRMKYFGEPGGTL